MLASNIHQKGLIELLRCLLKGFSFRGYEPCFSVQQIKQSGTPDIIYQISSFQFSVSNWTWSWTMHVIIFLPQIYTKMNGFKFEFSKNFWGGAHRAPSPDPSPRFFSGFALGSGFSPQFSGASRIRLGLQPSSSKALRTLSSGFSPQLSSGEHGSVPSKINS